MFSRAQADPELKQMLSQLTIFDHFRFVNTRSREVFFWEKHKLCPTGNKCYQIWDRTSPCANCTSRRAVTENAQMVKLEYLENKVVMIVSIPWEAEGETYALELSKDITGSLLINDPLHRDNSDVVSMVQELNSLAVRDAYTGLYNKKYIEKEIRESVHNARLCSGNLCAALLDIDSFKIVNDTYGHQMGDLVIKEVVRYISEVCASMGCWAGRLGGDEFLIVFEGMEEKESEEICHSLSRTISAHRFQKGERWFSVHVSIGLKEFTAQEDNEESFLDHVDSKMYEIKRRKKRVACVEIQP